MTVKVGDRIRIESERAAGSGRVGVVEEILSDDPPRLRVRWDDERETIFVPAAGSARFEHVRAQGTRKRAAKA